MDFQTLNRRELQALCKLNKIPANITNIAMVDALKSLETVEGIEEFLNPSRSESTEVMSPIVSRTTCRTTTRQKAKKAEAESLPATASRVSCHGVRRQWAGEVNEVLKTPLVKKETTLQKAYTTRRSTRLTAKKSEGPGVIERESSEPVKIDSFLDEVKDLGKPIEEKHDVVVLDESDENSKIEKVVHVDTTLDESGEEKVDCCGVVEKLKVNSVENFEQLEKMCLEDLKPDSEEKPMVIDEKIDLNEALNVSVKEQDAFLVPEEHTDNILIEADNIDENALSFKTQNPSDPSILKVECMPCAVSGMKNEVSECNEAPYIADNMIDSNSENPNQTSNLDDHNIAEADFGEAQECLMSVDVIMPVICGEGDKLNQEGDVDEVTHESSSVVDVSDNKENEEKMNEKEGDGDDKAIKSLNETSLRQLKKQLKALSIKNNVDATSN